MKGYVIRVCLTTNPSKYQRGENTGQHIIFESLRYAGLVKEQTQTTLEDVKVYDIYPPKHIAKSRQSWWADSNAQRMRTFGINAQPAPATD